MAFVSFSSQHVIENTTSVSNLFINNYMPACNGDCARVYLYGLYLCNSATRHDNTLDHMASTLNLTKEDVISAYTYWQDQGLVQILSIEPIQVKYLPIKMGGAKIKKYALDKYVDFNAQMQAILEGRMITPTEFSEYYSFLESFHVEPGALIMIAKHCADIKGNNVGYAYILTVAKNWAYSGIKTADAVREKLELDAGDLSSVTQILKALGIKRSPEPSDFELYTKWTQKMGFAPNVILEVAKKICKRGSMEKLGNILLKSFELKLFEYNEIAEYNAKKQELIKLAFEINKKIGVYYENVDTIVETYIVNWQLRGYDSATLLEIAAFCFKSGIRTLEGMDTLISKFYKQGITNPAAIDEFIAEKITENKAVKAILEKLNQTRQPNQVDRDFYKTWTKDWGFGADMINHAISLSSDKTGPMQYMNKVLSNWRENKVVTVDAAQKSPLPTSVVAQQKSFVRHSYSNEDLNRLFANTDLEEAFK